MRNIIIYIAVLLVSVDANAQIAGVSCCDWMMLKRQKMGAFTLAKQINADGVEMDMGGLGRRILFDNKFRGDVLPHVKIGSVLKNFSPILAKFHSITLCTWAPHCRSL